MIGFVSEIYSSTPQSFQILKKFDSKVAPVKAIASKDFLFENTQLKTESYLGQNVYFPGNEIQIVITILNDSNKELNEIYCSLTQHISLNSKQQIRPIHKIITETAQSGIEQHTNVTRIITLRVPEKIQSSLDSQLIQIHYDIQTICKVSALSVDLESNLPITICTTQPLEFNNSASQKPITTFVSINASEVVLKNIPSDSGFFEEEIWENERRILPFTPFSRYALLPTDYRGVWSHFIDGSNSNIPTLEGNTPEQYPLPSNGEWEWAAEWAIDKQRNGVDKDGWMYAFNWNTQWCSSVNASLFVRSRRWFRIRVKKGTEVKYIKATNNEKLDSKNDLLTPN